MTRARDLAIAFNDRINARDLNGLAALMTDDHTFTDSEGVAVAGKAACIEAWRGFFEAYPDYRNHFESFVDDHDAVTVIGHSECSEPSLVGPALWRVTVREGLVATWSVSEDTPGNRARLA
jgi:ketosteroid isomerase-like protein